LLLEKKLKWVISTFHWLWVLIAIWPPKSPFPFSFPFLRLPTCKLALLFWYSSILHPTFFYSLTTLFNNMPNPPHILFVLIRYASSSTVQRFHIFIRNVSFSSLTDIESHNPPLREPASSLTHHPVSDSNTICNITNTSLTDIARFDQLHIDVNLTVIDKRILVYMLGIDVN